MSLDAASPHNVTFNTNPRIVEHPLRGEVVAGHPLILNCRAESVPPSVITWYKDGKPLLSANEGRSFDDVILESGSLLLRGEVWMIVHDF